MRFSPSSGDPSSAYPPTTGMAGSKQNMRVWIVSAIALSGIRATIKIRVAVLPSARVGARFRWNATESNIAGHQ